MHPAMSSIILCGVFLVISSGASLDGGMTAEMPEVVSSTTEGMGEVNFPLNTTIDSKKTDRNAKELSPWLSTWKPNAGQEIPDSHTHDSIPWTYNGYVPNDKDLYGPPAKDDHPSPTYGYDYSPQIPTQTPHPTFYPKPQPDVTYPPNSNIPYLYYLVPLHGNSMEKPPAFIFAPPATTHKPSNTTTTTTRPPTGTTPMPTKNHTSSYYPYEGWNMSGLTPTYGYPAAPASSGSYPFQQQIIHIHLPYAFVLPPPPIFPPPPTEKDVERVPPVTTELPPVDREIEETTTTVSAIQMEASSPNFVDDQPSEVVNDENSLFLKLSTLHDQLLAFNSSSDIWAK